MPHTLLKLLLLVSIPSTFAMQRQPQRYPQVQVAPQKKSSWQAAREGDLNTLKSLITAHPEWVNAREKRKSKDDPTKTEEGLTPLAWAVIQLNKQVSPETYFAIVDFLVQRGANVNFADADGPTILHIAARVGNIPIIRYLLQHGAATSINASTKEKGRTPLAEVMRASKDAIIHLDIEKENLNTPQELENRLPAAIKQLADKEAPKLSTNTTIEIINLLKQYGAQTNPQDATGRTPDFYINEVQLISEPERVNLLRALNAPVTPRIIQYSETNLPLAIQMLEKLANGLEKAGLKPKINKVMWAIQAVQKESNRIVKSNTLRVAMALLSNVKEEVKNVLPDSFGQIEPHLDKIRTILRDTILILTGKVSAPSAPLSAAPAGRAPQQAQPVSAPAPMPSVSTQPSIPRVMPSQQPRPAYTPSPAPAQVPAQRAPVTATTQATVRTLRNFIIKSNDLIIIYIPDIAGNLIDLEKGTHNFNMPLSDGNKIELQYFDSKNNKSIEIGTIKITKDGMNLEFPGKQPIVLAGRRYDQFDIEIRENNTLNIIPA